MEVIRGIQTLNQSQESRSRLSRISATRTVITIGNFDGVHLGHRKIIALAIEKAKARGGLSVAYTFRPHPQVALRPDANIQLLLTYDEKLEALATCGLDAVVEEPFSREFSTVSPDKFFNDVLLRKLNAEAIVVGYDFAFGKERQGHLDSLEGFCRQAGVELTVVPALRVEGEVVSSSRIRSHLLEGSVDLAARLLGKPFFYRGVVRKGEGRGRKIGFPTANLQLESKLTLPNGVYATMARLGDRSFPSVTNIGVRPTFYAGDSGIPALIETHLLDQTIDLYGSVLEVSFMRRLREERRFSGVEELKAQIRRDVDAARAALAT